MREHEPSEADLSGLITSVDLPPAGTAQPQTTQERYVEPSASSVEEARRQIAEADTVPKYRVGDLVSVKRSDGRFEAGWKVDEVKEGSISVVRPALEFGEPNTELEKQVTPADLDSWRVEANDPIPGLKVGDPVKVLRTSGELEHGWLFASYNDGKATVQSIDPDPSSGEYLFKNVDPAKLASWQWESAKGPSVTIQDAGKTGKTKRSLMDRLRNK